MKVKRLDEAPKARTLGDAAKAAAEAAAAKDALGDDTTGTSKPDQIRDVLDRALVVNKREKRKVDQGKKPNGDWLNVLFVGAAGTGKTARIKAWARDNNVNLVTVLASGMDTTDMGGAISPDDTRTIVKRLATTEFDDLDNNPTDEKGNEIKDCVGSVLFLDEFNRADRAVRGSLLTLIQEHLVRDDRVKGKMRLLKNYLFTVAAVNPWDANYNTDELDDAEISRFSQNDVTADPEVTLAYYVKTFTEDAANAEDEAEKLEAERKIKLANALLAPNSPLKFDDMEDIKKSKDGNNKAANGKILTSRTLMNALQECDGTKKDLLRVWTKHCNALKKPAAEKALAEIKDVDLSKYKEVDDKATDAIKNSEKAKGLMGLDTDARMNNVRTRMMNGE